MMPRVTISPPPPLGCEACVGRMADFFRLARRLTKSAASRNLCEGDPLLWVVVSSVSPSWKPHPSLVEGEQPYPTVRHGPPLSHSEEASSGLPLVTPMAIMRPWSFFSFFPSPGVFFPLLFVLCGRCVLQNHFFDAGRLPPPAHRGKDISNSSSLSSLLSVALPASTLHVEGRFARRLSSKASTLRTSSLFFSFRHQAFRFVSSFSCKELRPPLLPGWASPEQPGCHFVPPPQIVASAPF